MARIDRAQAGEQKRVASSSLKSVAILWTRQNGPFVGSADTSLFAGIVVKHLPET